MRPSMPARRATAFGSSRSRDRSRRQWDDTLDWMTQRHNMPALADEDRKIVLDYLEATYPPRDTPRGWQNPFQNQVTAAAAVPRMKRGPIGGSPPPANV